MSETGPDMIQQAIDHMKQVGLGGLIHTIGQLEDAKAQWRADLADRSALIDWAKGFGFTDAQIDSQLRAWREATRAAEEA